MKTKRWRERERERKEDRHKNGVKKSKIERVGEKGKIKRQGERVREWERETENYKKSEQ